MVRVSTIVTHLYENHDEYHPKGPLNLQEEKTNSYFIEIKITISINMPQ